MITMMFHVLRPKRARDDDHQRDVRDHEEVVGEPHQRGVGLPAEEAGEDPDRPADERRDRGGAEADEQRDPRAGDRGSRPCSRRRRPVPSGNSRLGGSKTSPTFAFGSPSMSSGPASARNTNRRARRPRPWPTCCAGRARRWRATSASGSGRAPPRPVARPSGPGSSAHSVTRGSSLKYRRSASRLKRITDSVRRRNAACSTG